MEKYFHTADVVFSRKMSSQKEIKKEEEKDRLAEDAKDLN